jgi:hypothetical protein
MSIVSVAKVPLSLLTLNILSVSYLLAKGISAERMRRLVVAASVSVSCATLSPHLSLSSSGVVLECLSLERKVCGGVNSYSCSGPGMIGGRSCTIIALI